MSLSKKDLQNKTEDYWREYKSYDYYITHLLGEELTWASENVTDNGTARLRHLALPVHALAMTVGESFEPLLQSICVFRPQRLIFVLNTRYSTTPGEAQGNALKFYVQQLAQQRSFPEALRPKEFGEADFDLCVVQADTPAQVFRALRTAFQQEKNRPPAGHTNVIDITGAKKSMMAGAFLYAAHSDLPITYVDFDIYNRDYGKPYGYLCKIGKLDNPYNVFRLRDWERVRQLYLGYNFRSAKELLLGRENYPGILSAMEQPLDSGISEKLYCAKDIERAKQLVHLLEIYEAWDNGDFTAAKCLADSYSFSSNLVPSAVTALGDIWPSAEGINNAGEAAKQLFNQHLELKQGKQQPQDSLFNRPTLLLTYARDERFKIERLIKNKEDYRSAFLRAAGLHEWLLKARLSLCWLNNEMECWNQETLIGKVEDLPQNHQHTWFKRLVKVSNANEMRKALMHEDKLSFKDKRNVNLTQNAPKLDIYWSSMPIDLDVFQDNSGNPLLFQLRNEAIHTHLSIPRSVAAAALDLLIAALDEFEDKWLEYWYPGTSQTVDALALNASAWCDVCTHIGLDFLPPELQA